MVAVEAVAFVLIGIGRVRRPASLFWNDQVIRSNEFHTYFRVNSLFWDPNVYGRYLALVIVVATAALLWVRDRRELRAAAGRCSACSGSGLAPDLLAVELHRPARRPRGARGAALELALDAGGGRGRGWSARSLVVAPRRRLGARPLDRLNIDTSGRANLVSGGLDLFAERPLWGYGSGSFQEAYREHRENKDVPVSVSHTEPVTVAAEQGLIGLAALRRAVVVALVDDGRGHPGPPAGRGGGVRERASRPPAGLRLRAARAAVLAAFVALLVHTMAYAGFFEDPITWVLLAVGASLAAPPAVRDPA